MSTQFRFIRLGRLIDSDLELVLMRTHKADPVKNYVPMYEFEMIHASRRIPMGKIRLRIGSARALRFPGHIGFEVAERFRGRRYAARSCQLLAGLAYAHDLRAVWFSVEPGNVASERTCQILGARYVETVRIPHDHEMYLDGACYCRRYRLTMREMLPNTALEPTPTAP